MKAEINELLRALPAVDRVLVLARERSRSEWPAELLTAEIQRQIALFRAQLRDGSLTTAPSVETVAEAALAGLRRLAAPSLRRVLNLSGVLLHTNLGRAPLPLEALAQIQQVAAGYSNLEIDLPSGRRGSRHSHVEEVLCRLSGAEAALVVNNNAGAVLLALTALGRGREAIVSRGELVEIGGSFRIPEVMEAGGVILREVGSSNRTHLRDYQNAINPQSALLLKVHTSNYRIVGFTSSVSAAELVPLAREHQLPLLEDLGSGLLRPLPGDLHGVEPTVSDAIASGIDLLTCSGDKLLGGPQAGLILGRRVLIETLRSHPLARALRIDKLSLAALEATLRLYLQGEEANIPLRAFLAASSADLTQRSHALQEELLRQGATVELIEDQVMVGGGALPEVQLTGPALALALPGISPDRLATALRTAEPALVARIQDERLLINLRSVPATEDELVAVTLVRVIRQLCVANQPPQ